MNKVIDPKQKHQKVAAEDEWAHLTDQLQEKNTKIEASDAMDVQDRSMTFSGEKDAKSRWDQFVNNTKTAAMTAGSTSQYVKFVNSHLEQQRSHIDKLRELKERFDDEIANLQSTTANFDSISKIPLSKETIDASWQVLDKLIKEKDSKKAEVDQLRSQIARIENELREKEKAIDKIQSQLGEKKTDNLESAKTELEALAEKYGLLSLSGAIKKLEKSETE